MDNRDYIAMNKEQQNIKDLFKRRYRIVTDDYLGYECQIKKWYSPWWFQMRDKYGAIANTFHSIEKATKFIEITKAIKPRVKPQVVKHL